MNKSSCRKLNDLKSRIESFTPKSNQADKKSSGNRRFCHSKHPRLGTESEQQLQRRESNVGSKLRQTKAQARYTTKGRDGARDLLQNKRLGAERFR